MLHPNLVTAVAVQGLILVAVFRYRDRGGDEIPKQVAGNTRLELLWASAGGRSSTTVVALV